MYVSYVNVQNALSYEYVYYNAIYTINTYTYATYLIAHFLCRYNCLLAR